jgi:hypothetical protein
MSGGPRTARSMAYDLCEGLLLEVHPDCPPDEREWDEFVQWLHARDISGIRGLVFAEGPGPNAGQRRKLMSVKGMKDAKSIVLTTSVIARGAITALNWLGYRNIRGFDYKNLIGALEQLEVAPARHRVIAQRVVELKCDMLGVAASELMVDHDIFALATSTFSTLAELPRARRLKPRGPSAA